MSIKNILVAFTGGKQSLNALKFAKIMSLKHGAHVTGILAHGLPSATYSYGSYLPQTALNEISNADKDHRKTVRKQFFEAASDLPSERVHFLEVYGDSDAQLMQVAHAYDLVIMGRANKKAGFQHMEVHPDVVARGSGRPVFVIPKNYDVSDFNERALLAWDGKRAAARALSDALAILEKKSQVIVLSVGRAEDLAAKTDPVMAHLSRHNISAEVYQVKRNGKKISKIILEAAKETDAGMIVMGAYQHAKLAEDLFGGVTNRILAKANIPVLLSH